MKRLSQPTVKKSTCNRSSNYLYELLLDSEKEAQAISNDIHRIVKLFRSPSVRFSTRMTKRLLGNCCQATGRIKLFPPKGRTVGTLIHELAHIHPSAIADKRAHGFGFKVSLIHIREAWDQIKNKYMPVDLEKNWSPAAMEGLKDGFDLSNIKVEPVKAEPKKFVTKSGFTTTVWTSDAPVWVEPKPAAKPVMVEKKFVTKSGFTTTVWTAA